MKFIYCIKKYYIKNEKKTQKTPKKRKFVTEKLFFIIHDIFNK